MVAVSHGTHYNNLELSEVPTVLAVTSMIQQWHKPHGRKITFGPISNMVLAKNKVIKKMGPVLNNLENNSYFAYSENIHYGTMWDATIKICRCIIIISLFSRQYWVRLPSNLTRSSYYIYSYCRCSEEHFKNRFGFNTASRCVVHTHCSSRICTDVRPDAIAKLKAALPGTGAAYTVDEHLQHIVPSFARCRVAPQISFV